MHGTIAQGFQTKGSVLDVSKYVLPYESHIALQFDRANAINASEDHIETMEKLQVEAADVLERMLYEADIAVMQLEASGMTGKKRIIRSIGVACYNALELIPQSLKDKPVFNLRKKWSDRAELWKNRY